MQDCVWLVKWLIDVGIYESKVAEGFPRSSVGLVFAMVTNQIILTWLPNAEWILAADVLATEWARASAVKVFNK